MPRSLPILGQPPQSALRPDGGRNFVVPADVDGRYTRRKRILSLLLILVYVGLPWLQIGGHPAVFLDVQRRAFYLFGATFNAQDTWLLFFLLSGVGFLLILVTALFGRVWCGYACPQTVFLDGVFRRFERLIEGPRNLRMKRDDGPLTLDKAARKTLKHLTFFALSFLVSHVFLSYFVSLPQLVTMVLAAPSAHPEAFAWAFASTLLVYGNFAWFREQLCVIICPYGRLQSALTDNETLVIGYDVGRGEPRGKARDRTHGDCVDCARCVVVCPTGIDIRNGLQLDCIGCAACIDACDEVMTKLKRPTGLIRYDSQNGLLGLATRFVRPRLLVYAVLGLLGLCAAAFAAGGRAPFEANLLRLAGAPFVLESGSARVRNALELHLVNKHAEATRFQVRGEPGDGLEYVIAMPDLTLDSLASRRIPVFVLAPNDGRPRRVRLVVRDGAREQVVEAPFVAP